MLVPIENDPRPYGWGSTSAIAELTGREPSGAPEAEVWFGDHPGSPARVVDPELAGGHRDLAELVSADPQGSLGAELAGGGRLPFLLKILAADLPLSFQAHPTKEQARAGFAREDAAGVAVDAPDRSYRDTNHKPEMLVALSEAFDALCGFRPVAESMRLLDGLRALDDDDADGPRGRALPQPALDGLVSRLTGSGGLREAVGWVLGGSDDVAAMVAGLARLAGGASAGTATDPLVVEVLGTVRELVRAFPGDAGVVLALLVRRVRLRRGEALYLPAGNIHAYLRGTGVELMASSDNVLRGGLTPKHIDVPELLAVLDLGEPPAPPAPMLVPTEPLPGVAVFTPDVPDFAMARLEVDGRRLVVELTGPAVVLVTRGSVEVAGAQTSVALGRGRAAFASPDEGPLVLSGAGEVFVATVGGRAIGVSAVG